MNRNVVKTKPVVSAAGQPRLVRPPVQRASAGLRDESSSLSTMASIYGCCGLFDMCTDQDLMSLSFQGSNPFLDWIGWEFTDVCLIKKSFLAWARPNYAGGTRTSGVLGNPCADPNTVDFGVCDFTLTDFGRLRRQGPTRDITKNNLRLCENQPRYRLDGTMITDVREYDLRLLTEVMLQDIAIEVMDGNAQTAGSFDGLKRLTKTGYTNSDGNPCPLMDSIIVDWNQNNFDGGAGETWNGASIGTTFDLVDVLIEIVRSIRKRIKWTPALGAPLAAGDMIIMLPQFLANCLLDFYTCWSVCPGKEFQPVNLQTMEARTFRNSLNGGAFGDGKITIDGMEISLLVNDVGTITNANVGDIWVLTGQVGSVKLIQGQTNDMRVPATADPNALFSYTDGGRLLVWTNGENTCLAVQSEMQPRLLSWAPWAQARIQDVSCGQAAPFFTGDPNSPYFPGGPTGFYPAVCVDYNGVQLPV